MLSVQVEYWKLQETKRHNAIVEEQANRELGIKEADSASGRMTAIANLQNAQSNERNATTNELNAQTNLRNAEINAENAASNRMQAEASVRNAESNAKNAESNRITALANQSNAASNAANAVSNRMNAQSNQINAQANMQNAISNRIEARATEDYNTWRMEGDGFVLEKQKVQNDFLASVGRTDQGSAAMKQADVRVAMAPYEKAESTSKTNLNKSQTNLNTAKTVNTWVDTVDKGVNVLSKVGKAIKQGATDLWNKSVFTYYTSK